MTHSHLSFCNPMFSVAVACPVLLRPIHRWISTSADGEKTHRVAEITSFTPEGSCVSLSQFQCGLLDWVEFYHWHAVKNETIWCVKMSLKTLKPQGTQPSGFLPSLESISWREMGGVGSDPEWNQTQASAVRCFGWVLYHSNVFPWASSCSRTNFPCNFCHSTCHFHCAGKLLLEMMW